MQSSLDGDRGSIASGSGRAIFDAVMRAARRNEPPAAPRIARVRRPSIECFAEIRRAAVPVVIEGITDDWPARTTWSLAALRDRFGDRCISVINTDGGRLVADVSKGVAFRAMRFGDYIDQIEQGRHPGAYLAAPGTWLPELRDDVREPPYCRDAPVRISRFWLSAPGTSCPLHRDMAENIFCQIVGRKRFYLYPPAAAPWLYSNGFRSALPNYSRFDPEQAEYDRFPLSREVAPVEVVLGPGEAMYLPTRWWHQVRSLDMSMSYNFWWADGPLSFVVRAAELVKSARGLEIYGLEARERRAGAVGGAARRAPMSEPSVMRAPAPPFEARPTAAPSVSCVMPAFNEEEGIVRAVANVRTALERHCGAFEVIVVDDGSTDRTGALLDEMAAGPGPLKVIHLPENRGYGAALQAGFAAATLPILFFTDSDDQFDAMDLGRLLPLVAEADVVVGHRVGRRDGASRAVLSGGYNALVRALLGVRMRDINCAFKVVRRSAVAALPLVSTGYIINAELIARAVRAGLSVREVPVSHRPRAAGSSKVGVADVPRSLRELVELGWRLRATGDAFAGAPRVRTPPSDMA